MRTGSSVTRARIIEDRGNIGACGRRIMRVEVDPDPEVPGDEPLRF